MNSLYTPDRRSVPRAASSGLIELTFENPREATVEAELIELSSTGFRAAHFCKTMTPGLEVRFKRRDTFGRARVIWTHILGDRSVSGFLKL